VIKYYYVYHQEEQRLPLSIPLASVIMKSQNP